MNILYIQYNTLYFHQYACIVAPFAVDLSYTGVQNEGEDKDGIRVDFDYFGYLRNPDDYRRIRSTGVLNMDIEDVCDIITYHMMTMATAILNF